MKIDANSRPVVIVTGSGGLIGKAVVDALRDHYQVIGFDVDGQPQPPPEVECVCVDLTDDQSVQLGMARVRHGYGSHIASVVHLAAYYDFSGAESDLYEKVTVEGTRRLLQELQTFDVEQFIFSSTMLVHQPTVPGKPINEDSPLEPKWDYPESKVRTEQLIHQSRGSIPVIILRIAGVYTDWCDSIPVAHQIQRIAERRLTSHVYPGETTHGQAFVHLDDVVAAIVSAVERRRELGEHETLLIGEAQTYGYDLLQNTLGRLLHGEEDWTTESISKTAAQAGSWLQNKIPGIEEPFIKPWMIDLADDHYELDISRARDRLGWEPQHRLIDTLPEMVRRLKEDPQKWYERNELEYPGELKLGSEEDSEAPAGRAASGNIRSG